MRWTKRSLGVAGCLVLGLLAGCGREEATTGETQSKSGGADSAAAVAEPGKVVEVSWERLRAYLKAPKDEAVVVDFWATWCLPCVEGLPEVAAVAPGYRAKGVRILLVSVDEPEDGEAVRQALAAAQVPFGTLLVKPADRERMVQEIHPDWKGVVVPTSFVYDRAGKQVEATLREARTADDWKKTLETQGR